MEQTVEYYMEKGKAENAAGNYDEAREAFAEAIKLDPNNAQAYYERGKTQDEDDFYYEDAMEDLYKAVELDPNLTEVYLHIPYIYFNSSKSIREEKTVGDYIEMLTLHVSNRPKDPIGYHSRGFFYCLADQREKAIKDCTRAIELYLESNSDVYTLRGSCYQHIGEFDLALNDYNRAISIDPLNSELYISRGRFYRDSGKSDEAEIDGNIGMILFYLEIHETKAFYDMKYNLSI